MSETSSCVKRNEQCKMETVNIVISMLFFFFWGGGDRGKVDIPQNNDAARFESDMTVFAGRVLLSLPGTVPSFLFSSFADSNAVKIQERGDGKRPLHTDAVVRFCCRRGVTWPIPSILQSVFLSVASIGPSLALTN